MGRKKKFSDTLNECIQFCLLELVVCVCVRVRLSTFIMICHAFLCPLFITISMYRRSATCPSPHFDSRSSLFIQLFFFSKFSLVAAFQNERINIIFHLFGFFFPFDVGRLLSTIFSKCGKKKHTGCSSLLLHTLLR